MLNRFKFFKCDERMIRESLISCHNTAAEPDGFSTIIIKRIYNNISRPLLPIYQNSLHHEKFPCLEACLYCTHIHKSKGEVSDPCSYRPIIICSYFMKLLETIVKEQLESYVTLNYPFRSAQHDFTEHRSSFINLHICESIIA